MSEMKLQWRKMTAEELDQWDPAGVNFIAEVPALMEEYMSSAKVAVDEYTIAIEYSLPQERPDDPDALIAIRDHSMSVERAMEWVERMLSFMNFRKDLVEAGFRTEVL